MPAERLSMRKMKEVLRLYFGLGLSKRQVARSCSISPSTVVEYIRKAELAGICWPLPDDIDDAALESLLFAEERSGRWLPRPEPEYAVLHRELRRKGVTLELLWQEYKDRFPEGYAYSQFCFLYRRWAKKLDLSLRQQYRAGEKLFVDFAGKTVDIINPHTGEITDAQIFVGVLGASNYTYAEAVASQSLPHWIACHVNMFEYFGGVAEILIPDNLKSGVDKSCRYEPDINPTYQDLAEHYGTVVIPARPGKPRDKAKVECGVLVVTRWILAALRNRQFFSIAELNIAIRELLSRLNNRPFKKLPGSRLSLFETIDKPALMPLPSDRYQYAEWKKAAVNIDYHIEVDSHYYSVPYQLVRSKVDVRMTTDVVEVFFKSKRVAMHQRSARRGSFTTIGEHRPSAHQRYLQWTPSRIISWAQSVGEHTGVLIEQILMSKPHPEQGYRSCLGILRLGKKYTPERLEQAARRAVTIKAYSYRSMKSILDNGLDKLPIHEHQEVLPVIQHDNIRGKAYYN